MARPKGLAGFTVIWAGQVVSLFGTSMTQFALSYWVWIQTGQATAFALMMVFGFLPAMIMTPIAGALVDRWDRKRTMMLSDLAAGMGSVLILILYSSSLLQVWHLYIVTAMIGTFGAFQWPAYSAAISSMLDKKQYARADGMMGVAEAAPAIFGPPAAAFLILGLGIPGILMIDIATFCFAISMLLIVHIPRPKLAEDLQKGVRGVFRDAAYGFRYIRERKPLLSLQLSFLMVNLLAAPCIVLFVPMIYAKTNTSVEAVGIVQAAFGIGGLVGAILLAVWGGPKRRIIALLVGDIIAGLGIALGFGLANGLVFWAAGALIVSLTVPISNGASQAIWQSKVPPNRQGRVFAARRLIAQGSSLITTALAGPLADLIFTPGMMPGGQLAGTFGWLFGTGPGAGMALLIFISGLAAAFVVLIFYTMPNVRNVETLVPDWKEEENPTQNATNH